MTLEEGISKKRLFLENMIIFGFGGVLSNIAPLIMLPVVSRLVTDPQLFGIAELLYVAVSFLTPLAIAGSHDAVFREYFEKDDEQYHKKVLSSALLIVIVTTSVVVLIVSLFYRQISLVIFDEKGYEKLILFLIIQIIFASVDSVFHRPTRLANKRKQLITINAISPFLAYCIAILLILIGYPLIGLIMARMASVLFKAVTYFFINRKHFDFSVADKETIKKLLHIGIPLIPTFLIYWIFKTLDRIMIVQFLGLSQAGIYSMGARVAAVSSIIQLGFSQGWSYFAFRTMDSKNQVPMITNLVNAWLLLIIVLFGFASILINPLWGLFIGKSYAGGEVVVPLLTIAPLLLVVFQTISTQMLILRKSYIITLSLILGMVLNIVLNYHLIPLLGIKGAAIATVSGYMVSVLIAGLISLKHKLIIFNKTIFINYIILINLIIFNMYSFSELTNYLLPAVFMSFTLILNQRHLKILFGSRKK